MGWRPSNPTSEKVLKTLCFGRVRIVLQWLKDTTGNIQAKIATGSTYIIDIKEETKISAQYFLNTNSISDYVKISPEEFNYIEVDYDYYIIKNLHGVRKAVLKKMEHKKDKKY